MRETVTIDKRFGEQFEGDYEFRQVTQGEYERVLVSYMDALGKVAKQDILKVNREMLWLSLTKQPENKPLTKDIIVQGRLPYGLSIRLQEAYDKVNGIALEEQCFLSSPSDEKSPIPSSQSLSCAKSSDGQSNNTTEPAGEP
jgi:hypothetical protein